MAKGLKWGESKYKPELCDILIQMLSEGDSRARFCDKQDISYKTFDLWLAKYPEFQAAYEIGIPKAEYWWEKISKKHLTYNTDSDRLDHIVWSMNMRNRFGWTEHRKVKVEGVADSADFNAQYQKIIAMLAAKELTVAEAQQLAKVIETGVNVYKTTELEKRVTEIEKANAMGVGEDEFKEE